MDAGISRSQWARKARPCAGRVRASHGPSTGPDRVSQAAQRLRAPARWYACARRLGWWWGWAGSGGDGRGRGGSEVGSSSARTSAAARSGRVESSMRAATVAYNPAARGVWDGAPEAGARAAAAGPPASAARSRRRDPPRAPQRSAAAPVRGHPLGRDGGLGSRGVRRPGAPRRWPPPGDNTPLAPRPGASPRPTRRWARNRLAHWRTPPRWTPTSCATGAGACRSASRRIMRPRRTSPAASVVDRCQRCRVSRSAGDHSRTKGALRPRALALSAYRAKSQRGR